MSEKQPERPLVPLIPASVTISTDKPHYGWWIWTLRFTEERYENGAVVPWKDCEGRREITRTIDFSDVWDPVPDLHCVVSDLTEGMDYAALSIDEEGTDVHMQFWSVNNRLYHVRIWSEGYKTDYCDDYLVDRHAFVEELSAAYYSFGKKGGWRAGLDQDGIDDIDEDVDIPEPEVVLSPPQAGAEESASS